MEKLGYITRRQMPNNRKKIYVFLTPKGRQLKDKLVPLAEEVNTIAVSGVSTEHIAATRQTLLAIIENLARDDAMSADPERRIPSTRELASRVAAGGKRKSG
jgi:MarR family transcriptional regulator, organic hydroperoxide resistance regulator